MPNQSFEPIGNKERCLWLNSALSKHFKHKSSKYLIHQNCAFVDGVRDSGGLAFFKNQFYGSQKHHPFPKVSANQRQLRLSCRT
jgi:hypothetical protein